jgi:hypothetical protein
VSGRLCENVSSLEEQGDIEMAASALFGMLRHRLAYWREIRQEIRTERVMNALPPEVRKDIGWPDLHTGFPSGRARD